MPQMNWIGISLLIYCYALSDDLPLTEDAVIATELGQNITLVRYLGSGADGNVYLGRNSSNSQMSAVKFEDKQTSSPKLQNEITVYSKLSRLVGFPQLYWHGSYENYNVLSLELLGPTLEQACVSNGGCPVGMVLQMGIQLVSIIQSLHQASYIHTDIKPNNIALRRQRRGVASVHVKGLQREQGGVTSATSQPDSDHDRNNSDKNGGSPVYLLDFGDAQLFQHSTSLSSPTSPTRHTPTRDKDIAREDRDAQQRLSNDFIQQSPSSDGLSCGDSSCTSGDAVKNGEQHIAYCDGQSVISSLQYASTNVLLGICPSRRDDMESLTYSLIAAARGDHPWQQHLSKSRLNNGQAGISVTRTSSGQEESGNVVITGPRRVNALSSRAYRDTTTGNNSTKGNSNIGGRDSSSSVNRRERHLRMILLRSKTPINRLCSGLPGAFAKSMSYIKSLGYQEKPDYELLRSILREG